MRRGTLLLSLLLAAAALAPSSAAGVTFGANLAREPTNTTTCITVQTFPVFVPSCSVLSIDPTTGESTFPPAGEGIVSRFRVKVGPITGPMQIAEEEALRKDNPGDPGHPIYACCKLVALSQVFTPAPNSITTIPVNFHTKQDLAPNENGFYVDDHFSLSILANNVPIPAASAPNASVGIWFPAWQTVGEERAGNYGTCCGTVLLNGDWDPVEGAAPAGAGAGAPVGPVRLPLTVPDVIRVVDGTALLPLACNLAQACRGLLQLQNLQTGGPAASALAAKRPGSAPRKPKTITYGSVGFNIPAGKKKTVRARLKAPGRRLLKGRSKAKAWVNVRLKGTSATVPSARITLKLAAGRKRP